MPMKEIVDANPALRRRLYAAYAVVGTAFGATEVAFLAADEDAPLWLRVSLAVYLVLGTAFGFGARSKVDAQPVDVVDAQPAEVVIEPGNGRHRADV